MFTRRDNTTGYGPTHGLAVAAVLLPQQHQQDQHHFPLISLVETRLFGRFYSSRCRLADVRPLRLCRGARRFDTET